MVVGDQRAQFTEAARDLLEHGSLFSAGHVLVQPRDAHARAAPDRSGVRRDLSGNDFQEAGLAGAVAADERNALTGLDPQIGGVEERQVTKGERNGIEGNKGQ